MQLAIGDYNFAFVSSIIWSSKFGSFTQLAIWLFVFEIPF